MNVLVSNDDGIRAAGLRTLVDALASVPDVRVYVCAPDGERSSAGHSISTNNGPVFMKEDEVPGAVWARALSGTPADCVKFGIKHLKREYGVEIDAVCSGINHGGNLGWDVFYSGTVAAAAEANFCRVPAAAFSIDKRYPKQELLDNMKPLIREIAQKALPVIAADTVLNINFPGCAPEEIRGLKVTRTGPREYNEQFDILENPSKKKYFWYSGEIVRYEGLPEDTDIIAHQENFITITPLRMDVTDAERMDMVESWNLLKG